jgi:hypothetical protein
MSAESPFRSSLQASPQTGSFEARQVDGLGSLLAIAEPATEPLAAARSLANSPAKPQFPPRRRLRMRVIGCLPLLAVLIVQAFLSLRLVWSNTAFQDEALYLWAGRLEWSHWLHGTSIPAFPTYFSGAPVIYPPIAALANSIGGLAAARVLSLAFMLVATSLLWATASRLFGRRAGFFAAALWAVLGPTLKLGAFATFDAMSLCLMALAAWCAIRAASCRSAAGWTLAAGAAMVASDITAYSSIIFDPVIVMTLALASLQSLGWNAAKARCTSLLAYAVTAFALLIKLGGPWYVQGILRTVLDRTSGNSPVDAVASEAWTWTAALALLVGAGVIISIVLERAWSTKLLPLPLLIALIVVPVEQARIHTLTSMDKHVDVGAWFAAMAAGYGISRLIGCLRPKMMRTVTSGICSIALIIPTTAGLRQSQELFTSWPDAASFITSFQPIANEDRGPMLVETPSVSEYYLALAGLQWKRWSSTYNNILLPSGKSVEHGKLVDAPAIYGKYISNSYFSVIALYGGSSRSIDHVIAGDLRRNPAYAVIAIIQYGRYHYTIWKRRTTNL